MQHYWYAGVERLELLSTSECNCFQRQNLIMFSVSNSCCLVSHLEGESQGAIAISYLIKHRDIVVNIVVNIVVHIAVRIVVK